MADALAELVYLAHHDGPMPTSGWDFDTSMMIATHLRANPDVVLRALGAHRKAGHGDRLTPETTDWDCAAHGEGQTCCADADNVWEI